MMRRLLDLPLLVILIGLAGLAMFVPAVHAFVLREHELARSFVYMALLVLIFAGMLVVSELVWLWQSWPVRKSLDVTVGSASERLSSSNRGGSLC